MKEKTPTAEQLSETAKSLRSVTKYFEDEAAQQHGAIEAGIQNAIMHDGWSRAKVLGYKSYKSKRVAKYNPDNDSNKTHKRLRDESLANISNRILELGLADEAIHDSTKRAERHYKQHAADYHDIAVHEAAQDGVEIKITQQKSLAEPIEVHRK